MSGQQRCTYGVAGREQRVGDIVQCLRCVAEPVKQEYRPIAGRVAIDRTGAIDDAVGPEREARGDAVGERTRRTSSPPGQPGDRCRDRDQ
jgi:hypothetical protein